MLIKEITHWCNLVQHTPLNWEDLLMLPQLSWNKVKFTVEYNILIKVGEDNWTHNSRTHRRICAAIEGPYQSPALFPELLPNSTSLCIPKGAVGLSANHDTTLLCVAAMGLKRRRSKLSLRPLLLDPSFEFSPSRSMSSLTTWWLTDQVQPKNDVKMMSYEYYTTQFKVEVDNSRKDSWLLGFIPRLSNTDALGWPASRLSVGIWWPGNETQQSAVSF